MGGHWSLLSSPLLSQAIQLLIDPSIIDQLSLPPLLASVIIWSTNGQAAISVLKTLSLTIHPLSLLYLSVHLLCFQMCPYTGQEVKM